MGHKTPRARPSWRLLLFSTLEGQTPTTEGGKEERQARSKHARASSSRLSFSLPPDPVYVEKEALGGKMRPMRKPRRRPQCVCVCACIILGDDVMRTTVATSVTVRTKYLLRAFTSLLRLVTSAFSLLLCEGRKCSSRF